MLRILLSVLSVCLLSSPALAQWTNVGTGIDYRSLTITMADGKPNNLYVSRMAVANTNCIINSMIASNYISGALERPSAMAARCGDALNNWGKAWGKRNKVVVAINGSFQESTRNVIAGGDIYDGWYAKQFSDFGGQMGLVWKFDRSYFIGVCPHYQASDQTVTVGGVSQTFAGINIGRTNDLVIYTPQYNSSTLTDNSGVEVLVGLTTSLLTPPSTVTGTIEQVRTNQGSTPIPFDHLVLSGAGTAATYLQTYARVGQSVQISQNITLYNGPSNDLCSVLDGRDITQAYGLAQGNYNFLVNSSVIPTSNSGMIIRNPRTFLAYNATYVYFVVCDGRTAQSAGMTSDEMGAFCLTNLSATDGVNMDGGGSSVMVVNGVVKNSPSDGSERAVVNGLMMVSVQPQTNSTTFTTGHTVTTSVSANVRLGPGTDYYPVTTVASGTQGTVASHPINGVYAKGYYWWKCNFSGTSGWVAESTLAAPTGAPTISQQPANQIMDAGGSASFTVVAAGQAPLSYQWQKNQASLTNNGHYSGCAAATLAIANVATADTGSYRCIVTNSYGSVTSASATLEVIASGYAMGSLTNIPTLAGDTTNDARAITPDGLWVVGMSGTRGLLYDVWGGNVYNAFNGAQQLGPVAGVCYRVENGQKEIVVGGLAAGWDASLMTTNGAVFSSVDRYTYGGSGQNPVQGITNLRAAGGADVFLDAWWDVASQGKVFVGKFSGAWPASLTPTPGTWDTSSVGIGASVSVNAISGTGRAVGSLSSANRVFDWTGTGSATAWSYNGLNGTTAGAASAISSNGTAIFGQAPVTGGRSGNWPYKAVVTSASLGALQSITELPSFPDTVGTSGSAGLPYGCTADGKYAAGVSFRGIEKAVVWDTHDANPTNWTVLDLTDLAVAGGNLNIFSRLARAYSVGTNSAGSLVIAGMGWDTNSPARSRAFVMTVIPPSAPPPPPTAYNVTGGGVFCAGGGVPVGLSGSETNVNYSLNRNATNTVATLAGTGAALSFGLQSNPETYTVAATNASFPSSWTNMTGSAVVANDTMPPVITWFTNAVISAATNCQALMLDMTGTNYIVAVDNCGSVTVTQDVATNAVLSLGTNTVVLRAFDVAGNEAYCTNYVLVVDQTPPNPTCPTNIVVSADAGQSSKSNVTWEVTASDNCAVTNLVSEPPSGSTFPVGLTTVRCTAVDAGGNTNSCSFTVTVVASPPALYFSSVTLLPQGQVCLVLSGPPGGSVTIKQSSDLASWLLLTNLVNTNGTLQFTDTMATNTQQRFYRAVSP